MFQNSQILISQKPKNPNTQILNHYATKKNLKQKTTCEPSPDRNGNPGVTTKEERGIGM